MKPGLLHRCTLLALGGLRIIVKQTARAQERLPAGMNVVRLEAEPAAVALRHPYDYRQILLTGQLQTGERVDLTRMARVEADTKLVKVTPNGLIRPVGDGSGTVQYQVAGHSVT